MVVAAVGAAVGAKVLLVALPVRRMMLSVLCSALDGVHHGRGLECSRLLRAESPALTWVWDLPHELLVCLGAARGNHELGADLVHVSEAELGVGAVVEEGLASVRVLQHADKKSWCRGLAAGCELADIEEVVVGHGSLGTNRLEL